MTGLVCFYKSMARCLRAAAAVYGRRTMSEGPLSPVLAPLMVLKGGMLPLAPGAYTVIVLLLMVVSE
jgi:hypothetical protein